jgi:hypothetical protein
MTWTSRAITRCSRGTQHPPGVGQPATGGQCPRAHPQRPPVAGGRPDPGSLAGAGGPRRRAARRVDPVGRTPTPGRLRGVPGGRHTTVRLRPSRPCCQPRPGQLCPPRLAPERAPWPARSAPTERWPRSCCSTRSAEKGCQCPREPHGAGAGLHRQLGMLASLVLGDRAAVPLEQLAPILLLQL